MNHSYLNQKTNTSPLLSVLVLSYQHSEFISKCLDSILSQSVNFDYEIVIGDDGSKDGTQKILENYRKGQKRIHLRLEQENKGVFHNVEATWKACRGKYVALMEGDDLWTHPEKLSFQINFLENNADYNGCFHDMEIRHHELEKEARVGQYLSRYRYYSQFNSYESDIFPWHLIRRNVIPTSALVIRKKALPQDWSNWPKISYSLGELLKLMGIRNSKYRYFNEPWGIHNNHSGGITKKNAHRKFIDANLEIFAFLLKDDFFMGHSAEIYSAIAKERQHLFFSTDPRNDPPVDQEKLIEKVFDAKIRHALQLKDDLVSELARIQRQAVERPDLSDEKPG